MQNKKSVVFLVHGTFAPQAAWMSADYLLDSIADCLGGRVDFIKVPWGGSNTTSGRVSGAEALAEQIDKQPIGTAIYVVAHSHGGNVAHYALKHVDPARVTGIVTLNTPFICVTSRNAVPFAQVAIYTLLALATGWIYLSIVYFLSDLDVFALAGGFTQAFFLFWLGGFLTFGGIFWGVSSHDRIPQAVSSMQRRALADLSLPKDHNVPTLCLTSVGDEVMGFFNIMGGVSNIPFALLHPILIGTAFPAVMVMRWMDVLPRLGPILDYRVRGEAMTAPLGAILGFLRHMLEAAAYVSCVCLALVAAGFVLNLLLRVLPLDFKLSGILKTFFVRITFSYVPVTSRHTEFHEIRAFGSRVVLHNLLSLRHSSIFRHFSVEGWGSPAIHLMARWMLEQQADVTIRIDVARLARGELEQAEEIYEKALDLNEELGSGVGVANNYGNLGEVYETRGELDRAEEMHEKALALNKELGRKEGMANNYCNLGFVYVSRGKPDRAKEAWNAARYLYAEIGLPHMVEKVDGWLNGKR